MMNLVYRKFIIVSNREISRQFLLGEESESLNRDKRHNRAYRSTNLYIKVIYIYIYFYNNYQ